MLSGLGLTAVLSFLVFLGEAYRSRLTRDESPCDLVGHSRLLFHLAAISGLHLCARAALCCGLPLPLPLHTAFECAPVVYWQWALVTQSPSKVHATLRGGIAAFALLLLLLLETYL